MKCGYNQTYDKIFVKCGYVRVQPSSAINYRAMNLRDCANILELDSVYSIFVFMHCRLLVLPRNQQPLLLQNNLKFAVLVTLTKYVRLPVEFRVSSELR